MRLGIRGKILIFAAVVWAFIFGAYSVYIYKARTEQTRRMAVTAADLLSREITADRRFYTSTVVSRALDAGLRVTSAYHDKERSIPIPATFLREVVESLSTDGGFYIALMSRFPVNPESAPKDDFQSEALKRFLSGTESRHIRFEKLNGRESLRYMVPDIATSQACVDCHNANPASPKRDYKLGDVLGGLEITIPIESELMAAAGDIWRSIAYGFVVIVTLGFVGLAFIRRLITLPVQDLVDTTKYIAAGDLTVTSNISSDDEIGDLALQTNEVVRNLRRMIEDIRRTSDKASDLSARVKVTSMGVLDGSTRQGERIDAIVKSMDEINTSIKDIAGSTEQLAESVERGSHSALELGAGINEVVDNTEYLFESVDETARSTKDMSYSIKEISENIENLSAAIIQVSSSMVEINARIKEVETNAGEGNRFADEVIKDAKAGLHAVESTIGGIVKTKEITSESSRVIHTLCERIKEIGKILDVIRDVAEETNLLAINAAIIAAQTGEEGKSFAVVANEIKDLAERTTTSAKDVSEIIQAVEMESGKAGASMERGVESVEEGVRLAMEAGEGLKKIVESAQRSTTSVRQIARASADQAKGSRMVVEATEKVAEMTRRIVNATQEQARGSELINKATERMSEIAYKVKGSTRAQAEANRQITSTMDDVTRIVKHTNNVLRDQSKNILRVLETIESVRGVSVENIGNATETRKVIEEIARLNDELTEWVKKFKLRQ